MLIYNSEDYENVYIANILYDLLINDVNNIDIQNKCQQWRFFVMNKIYKNQSTYETQIIKYIYYKNKDLILLKPTRQSISSEGVK